MYGILSGRTKRVCGTMRGRATIVYVTVKGRVMRVYGRRGRAMRVYDIMLGRAYGHNEGGA